MRQRRTTQTTAHRSGGRFAWVMSIPRRLFRALGDILMTCVGFVSHVVSSVFGFVVALVTSVFALISRILSSIFFC